MIIQLILIALALADPNMPNILPDEVAWLDTPSLLATLFTEWEDERTEPYITVLVENWLRPNRLRHYPKIIDGTQYEMWTAPYSWAADLNHDEKMDMRDFGIIAAYYTGGLRLMPPPPAPPPLTKLKVMAMFMESLWAGITKESE